VFTNGTKICIPDGFCQDGRWACFRAEVRNKIALALSQRPSFFPELLVSCFVFNSKRSDATVANGSTAAAPWTGLSGAVGGSR